MILMIDGHSFHYEMENLCRIFFPYQKIEVLHGAENTVEDGLVAYTGLAKKQDGVLLTARFHGNSFSEEKTELLTGQTAESEGEQERHMAILLFELLIRYCGYTPKWGILTGVRPVKLLRQLKTKLGEQKAFEQFQTNYLVSKEKAELSRVTMHNEEPILALSRPESFSLYVSIPFCPSRCSYCSFVSSSLEQTAKLIPQYLPLLCEEIRRTGEIASELGLRLESVYVGGGTPTTLSAEQLALLLRTIRENFTLSTIREFTVEAGRPDTITAEKLDALKDGGITRISINPQTLNDDVLKIIGRRHTTAQTLSAFSLAREKGFHNINMDLIAGLPGDTVPGFQNTLDHVVALAPESITVHTLALKRSARMMQEENEPFGSDALAAGEMLDYADAVLAENGYRPYYLYRQSRMVGNLENTGWAKPGAESPYNVYIMDETQTILACGAGASSKIKGPRADQLERIFNFKYPFEYVSRFQEILDRKDQVKSIYERFQQIPKTE